MEEYLELVTLVMGFSIHLDEPEEVIKTVKSIKSHLFDREVEIEHFSLVKENEYIIVTYASEDYSLILENKINVINNKNK